MRRRRYREFVESGLAKDDRELMVTLKESPRSIGSDAFRAWVDDLHNGLAEKRNRPEDISFRRTTEPLAPAAVLTLVADELQVGVDEFRRCRRGSPLRAVAARCLIRYAAQSQRDVAAMLGVSSGAAVSKQLAKYSDAFNKERRLRTALCAIAGKISRLRKAPGKRS